jgi:hypothetical protein
MNVRTNPAGLANVSGTRSGTSTGSSATEEAGAQGFGGDSGFDGPITEDPTVSAALDAVFNNPAKWKGFSQAQVAHARERVEAELERLAQDNPNASAEEVAAAAKKAAGKAWANGVVNKSFLDRFLFFLQQRSQELREELNSDW